MVEKIPILRKLPNCPGPAPFVLAKTFSFYKQEKDSVLVDVLADKELGEKLSEGAKRCCYLNHRSLKRKDDDDLLVT